MDRWSWCSGPTSESILVRQPGVRLYDGEEKTPYEGTVELSPRNLFWTDAKNQNCRLNLGLALVLQVQQTPGGIGKSPKLVLHLARRDSSQSPGLVSHSHHNMIRMSFKNGGEGFFYNKLMETLRAREWEKHDGAKTQGQSSGRIKGAGIVGIERKREEKRKETDGRINVAFQDLSKLMEEAKEMVKLSQVISGKIKDKQGDITEDETVKFKSYLLSLGIPNPVTKETHGSGTHYHMQLAREITDSLVPVLQKRDGIILLSDAYCMINRARGMELLSPEDLINACKVLESMKLPIRLKTYESGVSVIQLRTHSEEKAVTQTVLLVVDSESLTAQQLSNLLEISVFLAKERLISAEKKGKLCRDDSVEGLRFFPNKFLM